MTITNADATLPSARGPLPGNGAMVTAVRLAAGTDPHVVGKPAPTLFRAAAARLRAERPLVVGDRLDTDIAGAAAAGFPSLLVLTGVSTAADLLAAPPELRPTYVARDLSALAGAAAPIQRSDAAPVDDGLDGLRDTCRHAWSGDLPREH